MSTLFGLALVEFTRTAYIVSCNSASAATWLLYDYVYSLEDEALAIINGLSYADFFDDIKPYPADWPIKACYYPYTPTIYNFSWTPILVFETVLFVLISVKCFAYRPLHEIPILQRVWRDGIIYYCVCVIVHLSFYTLKRYSCTDRSPCSYEHGRGLGIAAALATVTISAGIRNHLIAEVSATWISAVLSFSGAHLLLSLRALAAARDGAEVLTPMISGDIPDIVVESPSAPALPIDEHSPLSSPVDRHELLPHAHRALHSHNQAMPTTAIRRYSGSVVQWIRSRMYELTRPVN
ncbi:hypothetical protein WOLCODRAFT_166126 [Wolfiporia cocos MD-104 SS10]|uniref:Uncharacterized protein n=1 Tax=Wolfiporia cocos (strain MD-104) TaxID=742152 RepID=A0A2H3IZ41_WOLCO|nr:hypothetical protein WOLCODRAFT_166126 [Wolfiporia cocos MD-104 SS10]